MYTFLEYYIIERRRAATKKKSETSTREMKMLIQRLKDVRDYSDNEDAVEAASAALKSAPLRGSIQDWKDWAKTHRQALNVSDNFFSAKTAPVKKKSKTKVPRISKEKRERLYKNPDIDRKNPNKILVPRLRVPEKSKTLGDTTYVGSFDADSMTVSFYPRKNIKSVNVVRAVIDIPQRVLPKLDMKDKHTKTIIKKVIQAIMVWKKRHGTDVFLLDSWAHSDPVHRQLFEWAKQELLTAGWSSLTVGHYWAVAERRAALALLKRELSEGVEIDLPILTEKWVKRALIGTAAVAAAGAAAIPNKDVPKVEKPSYTQSIKKKNAEGALRYTQDLHQRQIEANKKRLQQAIDRAKRGKL